MIDEDFIKTLLSKHAFLNLNHQTDYLTLDCPAEDIVEFAKCLRDEETFDLLVDLTAIDHGTDADERFSVVLHLYSRIHRNYLRIHSSCGSECESPQFPSLSEIFPAANWHERETYDMFGIIFTDHPNMKRILMWDEYPYFPLRKEFPLAGIETDLPADDVVEVTQAEVEPAPMMGGPFVAAEQGF
ncbi:MAG: NADH-quinone oxidoreductase subunit C, partial [Verrucomicrobiota bacterium]|nr:NADH-quinone oxidoreductase subunit C [Verrucomicrobiota bacterium]